MNTLNNPELIADQPKLELGIIEFSQKGKIFATRVYTVGNQSIIFGRLANETLKLDGPDILPNSAQEIIAIVSKLYNDARLAIIADKIKQGIFDQETTAVLDLLLASIYFKDGSVRDEYGIDPLDDFLLYIGGDQYAGDRLNANLKLYHSLREIELDKERRRTLEHSKKFNYPELDPKDLVLVHATNFEPTKDESGKIVLKPLANYEKCARGTLHFTINSVMEPHFHRPTEGRYILVSSLDSLIQVESCGVPDGFNAMDTIFSLSPGESLRLPEDTIVLDRAQFSDAKALNSALIDAMKGLGATNIYKAVYNHLQNTGNSTMDNIEFIRGITALAHRVGSSAVPLQLGSSNAQVETMFAENSFANRFDHLQTAPYVVVDAVIANLRWAVLKGMWPTFIQQKEPRANGDLFDTLI